MNAQLARVARSIRPSGRAALLCALFGTYAALATQPTPIAWIKPGMLNPRQILVTPDERIAVVNGGYSTKAWAAQDGHFIRSIPADNGAAISLSPDGALLAAADSSRLNIYRTSDWVRTLSVNISYGALACAFSADGNRVMVAENTVVRARDAASGAVLQTYVANEQLFCVFVTPDNARLIAVDLYGRLYVWDLASGNVLVNRQQGYLGDTMVAALSPDGELLALSGNSEPTIRLVRTADGALLRELSDGESSWSGTAFSRDGATLYASGYPNLVNLRVSDGAVERRYPGISARAAVSPDGTRLYLLAAGIPVLRLADGVLTRPFERESYYGQLTATAYAADSPVLFAADERGLMWSACDGADLGLDGLYFNQDGVRSAAVRRDGGSVIAISGSFLVREDVTPHEWRWTEDAFGASAVFTLDDSTVLAGGVPTVRSVSDGAVLRTFESPPFNCCTATSLSRNGRIAAGVSGQTYLWNVLDGTLLRTIPTLYARDVALSPDGATAAVVGYDVLEIYRVGDGELVTAMPLTIRGPLTFSPDGHLLAVCSLENRLTLFRTTDWSVLAEYTDEIVYPRSIAFSPDGGRIAIGRGDATLVVLFNPASRRPGDCNCNGRIDAFDVDPFITALSDFAGHRAAYPCCNPYHADIDGNGLIDNFDIDPFVDCLVAGACP